MNREALLTALRNEAQRIAQFAPEAVWYLFGSALQTPELATDIDVLVLCKIDKMIVRIRHELTDACLRLPLHLFLVTEDEEAELGFIAAEGCFQLYPEPK